jgi:hypothetical protein
VFCFHQGICLDIDHRIIVCRTNLFGQDIIGTKLIESSEPKSHSCPRLPIYAYRIKWFKTHILFLDFDWCLIEVTFTLHIIWTSIGSLGWIAEPPHSSWMKCEAFHQRRGWVERNSFPSWPELRIVLMAHRVTHHLSLWGHERSWSCSIRRPNHPLHEHKVPFWFVATVMLILVFSMIYCSFCQVVASHTIILRSPIIDAL